LIEPAWSVPGPILLHLINEILEWPKIESGSLVHRSLRIAPVQDIVDPVIEQLNTLSSKKGLPFGRGPRADVVFADKFRARLNLQNLIAKCDQFTRTQNLSGCGEALGDVVKFRGPTTAAPA